MKCMGYEIVVEDSKTSQPRLHELKAAELIVAHFASDIIFMRRVASKTPDIYVLKTNVRWELKSPMGGSKYTIQNNLREASGQSENVILDLSRAKLTDRQGISRAREFLKKERSRIKHLKIITKTARVIDIK